MNTEKTAGSNERPVERGRLSPAASGQAFRAARAILAGSEHGAVRWHGPDEAGQWCWHYRRVDEIAAIIEVELAAWRECAKNLRPFAISYRSHPLRSPSDRLDEVLALYDALEKKYEGGKEGGADEK